MTDAGKDTLLEWMLWAALFLAALIALSLALRALRAVWRRGWRSRVLWLGVPAACGAWLVMDIRQSRAECPAGVFDTAVTLGAPVFEHRIHDALPRDGYSFAVYDLPAEARRRFERMDELPLTEYPRPREDVEDSRSEPWRPAPVPEGDHDVRERADLLLSSYFFENTQDAHSQGETARDALSRKGAYYAFRYRIFEGRAWDVEFFLVDLTGNRLYLITSMM